MSIASSIEERIVQMRFDNKQFEQGAKESLSTLDKLDNVLDQLGEGGGLDHIESSLDFLEKRFSTLGIAGVAAISKITSSVMNLAGKLLTAIPNQIASGGWTRAANIEQARFQLKGLGVDWEDVSDDIDLAVKGTAYGMDEAAVAASQFAATFKSQPGFWKDATESMNGYDEQVSKMAISLRAISGVAGMTNTSYSEIADIFTSVSGTGKLMTQDLRRLEGRGLNAAATMGEVLGKTETEVRDMVTKGKIDFYTFASAMDYAFGQHAKDANETFNGSLANMKAALSRIGADFATPIRNAGIVVFNAFRQAFDRARKITQPFAEGKFVKSLEPIAAAIARFADSLNFDGLKAAISILNDLDVSGVERAIDKITSFNNALHDLFRTEKEVTVEDVAAGPSDTAIESVTEYSDEVKNLFDQVQKFKSQGYTDGGIAEALGITEKQVHEYADPSFLDVSDPIEQTFNAVQKLKREGYTEGGIMKAMGLTKEEALQYMDPEYLKKYLEEQKKAIVEVNKTTGKKIVKNDPAVARVNNLKAAFNGLKVVFENLKDGLSIFNGSLFSGLGGSLLSIFDKAIEKVGNFGRKLQTLKDYFKVFKKDEYSGMELFNPIAEQRVQRIKDLAEKIRSLLSPIGRIIKASWDIVKSVTSSVFNFLKSQSPIASSLFGTVYNILLKVISKVADFAETLRDLIVNNNVFNAIFGAISASISTIGSVFTTVTSAVGNFLKSILKLKEGQTVIERIMEILRGFGGKISGAFTKVGEKIRSVFSDKSMVTDATKMSGALVGFLIAWRKFQSTKWKVDRFKRTIDMIKSKGETFFKDASALANLPDRISTILGRTSGALRAFTDNLNAKSLVAVGLAVLVLAAGLAVLSAIDDNRLATALFSLLSVLTLLVGAFAVINYLSKGKGFFGRIGKLIDASMMQMQVKSLFMLAAAVLAVAAAVWILSKADPDRLGASLASVLLIIGAMTAALAILSKKANMFNMGAVAIELLAFGASLILVAVALAALAYIPWDKLLTAAGALIVMIIAMTAALKILTSGKLKNGGEMMAAGASILMIAMALTMLVIPLVILSFIPWQKIAIGLGAMLVAIVILVAALKILSGKGFDSALMIASAFAMVLVAAAVLVLVAAIAAMAVIWSAFPWQAIVFGGLALIVMLFAMVGALAIVSGFAPMALLAAAAFLVLGVSLLMMGAGVFLAAAGLIELATAINMLTGVNFKEFREIGRGLKEIGKGMKHLGVGGILMSLGIDAFAALVPLASSLAVMHDLDMFKLGPGLAKIGQGLKKIGIAGVFLLIGSAGLIAGVPALTGLAAALPTLASGIEAFESLDSDTLMRAALGLSSACTTLFALEFATIHDGTESLRNLATAMPEIADGFNSMSGIDSDTIQTTSDALGKCVKTLFGVEFATLINDGTPALRNLAQAMPEIADGMNALSGLDSASMETSTNALNKCIKVLFGSQFASFGDGSQQLKILGEAMPGIARGMSALGEIDGATMSASITSLKDSIKLLFELKFSDFAKDSESLIVIGDSLSTFVNGISGLNGVDFDTAAMAFAFIQDNYPGLSGIETGKMSDISDEVISFAGAIGTLVSSCTGLSDIAASLNELAESISNVASSIGNIPDDASDKLGGLSGISIGGKGGIGGLGFGDGAFGGFGSNLGSELEGEIDINSLVDGELDVSEYIPSNGLVKDKTQLTKLLFGDGTDMSGGIDTSGVAEAQSELNNFDPSTFISNLQETNNISGETTAALNDLFSTMGEGDPQVLQNYMSGLDFSSMSDSDIRAWAEGLKGSINVGDMIDTSSVETAANEVVTAAAEIPAGVQQGIESNTAAAQGATEQMGTGILGWFKSVLGIASPSEAFAEAARGIPAGVELGITENTGVATAAVESMATALTDTFSTFSLGENGIDTSGVTAGITSLADTLVSSVPMVTQSSEQLGQAIANGIQSKTPVIEGVITAALMSSESRAFSTGANFAQGFANGIRSRINEVINAARALAQSAKSSITIEIKSHSPSKVTEQYGKYFGQGFAIGILGQISNVASASSNLADGAIDSVSSVGEEMQSAMASAMTMIAAVVNSDMEMSPRITPVVDLSSIDTAEMRLTGTFGRSYNVAPMTARTSAVASNMRSFQDARNTSMYSGASNNTENITNLYIDGIKYNTDEYVDSSISGFIETMVRKQKMYA